MLAAVDFTLAAAFTAAFFTAVTPLAAACLVVDFLSAAALAAAFSAAAFSAAAAPAAAAAANAASACCCSISAASNAAVDELRVREDDCRLRVRLTSMLALTTVRIRFWVLAAPATLTPLTWVISSSNMRVPAAHERTR